MVQLYRFLEADRRQLSQLSRPGRAIGIIIIIIIGLGIITVSSGLLFTMGDVLNNNESKENFEKNQIEIGRDYSRKNEWFTENQGQIENPDVRFVYSGSDCSIGFLDWGFMLKISDEENETSIVQVTLKEANTVEPSGKEELDHRSNYFLGNDSSQWRSNIRNYQKVIYKKCYDGIDLVFYTTKEGVKYDLIVFPGGNPDDILFSYEGADDLFTDNEGNLHIECPSGELIEKAPYSYQTDGMNNEKVKVASWYAIENDIVSFNFGKYDPTLPLIIDPLIFSTFVGGCSDDYAVEITHDAVNNIYVAGSTNSPDFPTTAGCYDVSYNGDDRDIVVVKLSPDGSELLYSTFIGGTSNEFSNGIAIDNINCLYVSGHTNSSDFPTTPGCYDDSYNGDRDALVFKLNSEGTNLLYSTFVGGIGQDYESQIILDSENNAYVSGITNSPDFPTTLMAYDRTYNGGENYGDVFVFKLNSDGSDLDFSTFVGGSMDEWWDGSLIIDSQRNIYVTGASSSPDFPTTWNTFDQIYNGGATDVFVFKLNSEGSNLIFSTFIGGDDWDRGWRIALDSEENAYVTGWTYSDNFPTTSGCYDDSLNGSMDIFICKFNQDGSELLISTLLGGTSEGHSQIAVDSQDNVFISSSAGDDFPVTHGCYDDSHNGAMDVVVCKLSSDLSELLYSTYIGGNQTDRGYSISLISEDNVYVTGFTDSSDFPTTSGCYDDTYNSGNDIFVLRLGLVNNDDTIDSGDDDETLLPPPSLIIIGIIGVNVIGLLGFAYFREDMRYIIFSMLSYLLYSKIEKHEILDQTNRQKILSYLYENPGINLTRVYQEMGIGYGTLVHHLNVLEKENFIRSEKEMGLKLFYPKETDWESTKESKEILLSPPQTKIYEYLKEKGSASRMKIQKELGINRHTANYNLRRLCEWGFIARSGRGNNVTYKAIIEGEMED